MIHGCAETHKRTIEEAKPRTRSRCTCGCKKRASHLGLANGVALMSGCELKVRRWVRDGAKAYTIKNGDRKL